MSARYGITFVLLTESSQPAYGLQRLLNTLAEARRQGLNGELLWQILPSPYLQVDSKPLMPAERHKETLQRIRQSIKETGSEKWVQPLEIVREFPQKFRDF
ncbi:MAG: hypothetical protein NZ781_05250 [Armatimonadetes bacterium]|nr:hypothetical protein [Armatimonadota bacterium]